jgi:hypothetical protein
MQSTLRTATLAIAATLLAAAPASSQSFDLCRLFCLDSLCGRGYSSGYGCGDCGCEPSCGFPGGCGMSGRPFAGQAWEGSGCNGCVNPNGCGSTCVSGGCDRTCGCGPSCCESTCGCEPTCGCSSGRSYGGSCCLTDILFGCQGCNEELYWCEWRNDPPRCCDPCDRYGNWIGPSARYRAPYSHPYGIDYGVPYGGYVNNMNSRTAPQVAQRTALRTPPAYATNRTRTAQSQAGPPAGLPIARRPAAAQAPRQMSLAAQTAPTQVARRPVAAPNRAYQR